MGKRKHFEIRSYYPVRESWGTMKRKERKIRKMS
jgi:hypothetical protein